MAVFANFIHAFHAQEWFNLTRDDVLSLRRTPPLVTFVVGWFSGDTAAAVAYYVTSLLM
jgi:hypothetical protein